MPFRSTGLSTAEIQMVDKLVDACRLLDDVYWRQSDLAGLTLYKTTKDPTIKELLTIMGSRWDLLDANKPFVGTEPMPPGHELYPNGLTRAQIEQYVAQHPATKAAIYDPYTVVERSNGALTAIALSRPLQAVSRADGARSARCRGPQSRRRVCATSCACAPTPC